MTAKKTLTPLKKKFCDLLLHETDNQTLACKKAFGITNDNYAHVKADRMIHKDANVISYLREQSESLAQHLVHLGKGARSEQVQATCTINALDRILGKPIGQEGTQTTLPQINIVNFFAKDSQ